MGSGRHEDAVFAKEVKPTSERPGTYFWSGLSNARDGHKSAL